MAKKDAAQDAKPDETIPGGKYVGTDGQLKNANGQRIDESGTVIDGSTVSAVDIPAEGAPPPAQ